MNIPSAHPRTTFWLLFTIFGGLLPLLFAALGLALRGGWPSLGQVVGNGDLYLVALPLAVTAVGRLHVVRKVDQESESSRNASLAVTWGSLFLSLFASYLYAQVRVSPAGSLSEEFVVLSSGVIYVVAVGISFNMRHFRELP